MKIITLTTDFGNKDWFVGTIKGVILSMAPTANIVDISHEINSFNIKEAAFVIKNFYAYFPKGTIHCIIVDPGVGFKRNIIALKTEKYCFITPDNGILTYVLQEEKIIEKIKITNYRYALKNISFTFHGRDIFAPLSAYLSQGIALKKLGEPIKKIKKFPLSKVGVSKKKVSGEIIFIDKFGNIILNIPIQKLKRLSNLKSNLNWQLKIGKKKYALKFVKQYSAGQKKELILLEGSSGYLEIALNQDSAQNFLKANYGTKLEISKLVKK